MTTYYQQPYSYPSTRVPPSHLPNYITPEGYPSLLSSNPEESLVVPRTWFLKDVTVYPSRVLGKGSFGTVCLGEWLGCPVAVKRLHEVFFHSSVSDDEKRGVLQTFAREVNILFQLKHPNIVTFYGVYNLSAQGDLSLISDTCLVQELLCMSLNTRNRQKPNLTYRNTLDLSMGITGGLRYLHERRDPIVHRDLASKNILLSEAGIPKLADLGVAKVINSTQRFNQHSRQPGTDLYMPPEVKVEGIHYDSRMDVYSLGVIILEMCIGRDPIATEAFRMSGEGLEIVPEVERRRRDLQELGDSPMKPLVLSCLLRREERPEAKGVYEKLKYLKTQRQYTTQSHTPIIIDEKLFSKQENCQCEKLEEKVRLLLAEREHLQNPGTHPEVKEYSLSSNHALEHSSYETDQDRLRRLEALLRSQDAELAAIRSQNISLEQELGHFRTSPVGTYANSHSVYDKQSTPPAGLTPRNVPIPNGTSLPSSKSLPSQETELTSELKQVKRQLEKYKDLTIELDSKLKDARVELSKHNTRQTSAHIQSRYELEAMRAENHMLRSDLERARREAHRYQQSSIAMRGYGSRY